MPDLDHCILCPNGGQMTREHIWSEWYSEMKKGRRYEVSGEINGRPVQQRPAKKLDLAPRVLCGSCNSNWGSKLEMRAQKLLEPMIDGQPIRITLPGLRLLVVWATLKFMAAEWMVLPSRGGKPFFTEADRARLRTKGLPTPWSKLWIGRYVGTRASAGWIMDQRSTFFLRGNVRVETEVYAVTYSSWECLIQLLAVGRHEELDRSAPFVVWAPSADWDAALSPIWPLPSEPIEWPPLQAFDDQGFEALAGRWHQPQQQRKGQPKDQPAP
jgi:hypothetical protein